MILSRRGLIAGLSTLFVAPALVRAESLMKISGTPLYSPLESYLRKHVRGDHLRFIRAGGEYSLPMNQVYRSIKVRGEHRRFIDFTVQDALRLYFDQSNYPDYERVFDERAVARFGELPHAC